MGALLYLALSAPAYASGAYFTLVGRIGASKAAYSTLLFPLVALTISTFMKATSGTVRRRWIGVDSGG